MKSIFFTKIAVMFVLLLFALGANATEYYVDANTSSSTQNGTQTNPWKTIAQVNSKMSSFTAGDFIYFKRGGTYTGTLTITRSGTASAPITFTNYGSGDLPIITTSGRAAITMYSGRNYIVIDGFNLTDLNMDPDDHYAQANLQVAVEAEANYLTIRNCHISLVGAGINLSGDNCTIENNTIENLRMIKNTPTSQNSDDDYGASPIVVSGAYNNILGNTFRECWAYSYDYGFDGGGVEFYGAGSSNNKIMYNSAINCNGFMEFGSNNGGESANNIVAYNMLVNCVDLVYVNSNGQYAISVKNLQVYNNVFVENKMQLSLTQQMIIIGSNSNIDMRNNIFWLSSGVDVAKSGIFNLTQNTHENNIYKLSNGSVLNFTANASEQSTSVNLFANTTNSDPLKWDYSPVSNSPAVKFGVNVGLKKDFAGVSIEGVSNPNAGLLQGGAAPAQPLAASAVATQINCFGDSSTVTVTATGGTSPYTGVGNFKRVGGTYTFTVKDAVGASINTSVTISQPASALTANSTAGTINVFGGSTQITTTATGGTSPYTYKLNNGSFQSSNIFTAVTAGTHSISVKDAKGCTTVHQLIITQPSEAPTLTGSATATSILCNGGNAVVTVSATGGVSPYTGTGNFDRTAGTYTFTVKDAAGKSSNVSITITEPTKVTASATAGTITVNGGTTTITVSATGGTPTYTYRLNNGNYQSSTSFTNVAAGTHTVTVRDVNGCTSSQTITITQPEVIPTLVATATATSILCNGGNAVVTVSATGGVSPYTGTGNFDRTAGTYTFTVKDAAGKSANATITISEPTKLTASATAGTITVNGGTTTITASATGGTPTYTYRLNSGNYQTSATFTTVVAGTYTVSVRDANGCTSSQTITITQPAPTATLVATATTTSILCNGGNAVVTVSATGGVSPYTGIGNFDRTAGTYTFTVKDAAGKSADATITISEPIKLTASASSGTITVNGGTTTITASATGGTPTYTYRLNNGNYQTSTSFTNVAAGTHTVTVRDVNGCTSSQAITITQPAPIPTLVATATATSILCNGETAVVTVSATGGVSPYTGTGNFDRTAGTYTFTVKDAAGKSADATITISEPTKLTAFATAGTITVNGGSTTITASATGGTPTYTYRLNSGNYQTSATFTTVVAGTYTVTARDANGCTSSYSITITQPAASSVVVTANAGTISCYGGTTTVTVSATGGTSPYTGTGTFTKSAGTHTFTVTDAAGKSSSKTVTISQPELLTSTITAGTISVNGGTTSISISAAGGTAPYTYKLNNGTYQSSSTFTGVAAGTHSISVRDAKACTITSSVSINQPAVIPTLVAIANAGTISCNGGTTIVTITGTGGVSPYTGVGTFTKSAGTHSFSITDAAGKTATTSITINQPTVVSVNLSTSGNITINGGTTSIVADATGGTAPYTYSINGSSYQTVNSFIGIGAGTYTISVKDKNNCTVSKSITITQPAPIPADIVVNLTATAINCYGGNSTVTVTATGGTAPYSGVGSFVKIAGAHNFTVTDANGKSVVKSITISQPALISASSQAQPIQVVGGTTSITVTSSGGSGTHTFSLNNSSYQTANVFGNISSGSHNIRIKDANGCIVSNSINIETPATVLLLTISLTKTDVTCKDASNGSIKATAGGGKGPLSYKLNNGQYGSNSNFDNLAPGNYKVTVKDSANTIISKNIVVNNSNNRCKKFNLLVLGNPTINEFRVKVESDLDEDVQLFVLNIRGQRVYSVKGRPNELNVFGKDFPQGTYILRVVQGRNTETTKLIKGR